VELPQGTKLVAVENVIFGNGTPVVMAGPCSVETEEQLFATAEAVARLGIRILRGGAYKPSTSPHGFQGLGSAGLDILREAKRRFGLLIITEVMDPRKVERVSEVADILQIGARNMQNFDLLKEVGKGDLPVMVKRGLCATYDEWMHAAEYVSLEGNERILLCERGIRTFETHTRNTLDLASPTVMKAKTGYPVIVDPTHGTGRRELVAPLSLAAVAAGADGLIIEVHPDPDHALKDGGQSLNIDAFAQLLPLIKSASFLNRTSSASRAASSHLGSL